jgi:hypothetical protein
MSYNTFSPIVTNGLVLYLDAANTKSYPGSGTNWIDLSGNGNNGTLVGATFSNSNSGIISLNGVDNYISVPDSISWNFTTSVTVECWIYINSYGPGGVMFMHQQNGTDVGGFEFWSQNNNLIRFNKNSSENIITSSAVFSTGRWNHVVATVEGSIGKIYLNSTLVGGTSIATLPDDVSGQLRIGGYSNVGFYELNGKISQVRIYKNKSLSSSEVLQNYNATKNRFI